MKYSLRIMPYNKGRNATRSIIKPLPKLLKMIDKAYKSKRKLYFHIMSMNKDHEADDVLFIKNFNPLTDFMK